MTIAKLLGGFAVACLFYCNSYAGILYESGTLGETNIPRIDVGTQVVLGSRVVESVFNGARFELTEPALTTSVGGHFVGPYSDEDSFFGAIVRLTDEHDFPDSGDLSTPDVLGATLLSFPLNSTEVFGDLSLRLSPGWYAVVFGSGLFGAEGRGAAVRNNIDIEGVSYIEWQPVIPGTGWWNHEEFPTESDGQLRFVVNGTIIPEPSTLALLTSSLLWLCRRRPICLKGQQYFLKKVH